MNPYCSPLVAEDHSGLPPAFIACAEYDPLCDDGRNYAESLRRLECRLNSDCTRA